MGVVEPATIHESFQRGEHIFESVLKEGETKRSKS
jgi:hypothetical protein